MRRPWSRGGQPAPGSSLDQAGLTDGIDIIEDHLEHNEAGLALEHLIYMVREPPLPISLDCFRLIERAATLMGFERKRVESIGP